MMKTEHTWVKVVRERGWTDMMQTAFNVIDPVAPLVGQFLWMLQPLGRWFGAGDVIHEIANTLEQPDGVERLRQQLKAEVVPEEREPLG